LCERLSQAGALIVPKRRAPPRGQVLAGGELGATHLDLWTCSLGREGSVASLLGKSPDEAGLAISNRSGAFLVLPAPAVALP